MLTTAGEPGSAAAASTLHSALINARKGSTSKGQAFLLDSCITLSDGKAQQVMAQRSAAQPSTVWHGTAQHSTVERSRDVLFSQPCSQLT